MLHVTDLIHIYIYIYIVRLNLFNHVLALFYAKFACILAIRYPVFRWELCKGFVWKSVKKTQDVCIPRSLATGYQGVSRLDLATDSWLAGGQNGIRVKHAGNWRFTIVGALQDKMYSMAKQLAHDSNSRFIPFARLSHQNARFRWNLTFHIPHIPYYKYPYTHKM